MEIYGSLAAIGAGLFSFLLWQANMKQKPRIQIVDIESLDISRIYNAISLEQESLRNGDNRSE